jgi:hypothetical protein
MSNGWFMLVLAFFHLLVCTKPQNQGQGQVGQAMACLRLYLPLSLSSSALGPVSVDATEITSLSKPICSLRLALNLLFLILSSIATPATGSGV